MNDGRIAPSQQDSNGTSSRADSRANRRALAPIGCRANGCAEPGCTRDGGGITLHRCRTFANQQLRLDWHGLAVYEGQAGQRDSKA
jgi:hypothetical protein